GGRAVREKDLKSNVLIDVIKKYQLNSFLPTKTVIYNNNNIQTYINLYYGIQDLVDKVVKCEVNYEMDYNSNYFVITTILDLRVL
ncbi:hypothetical protein DL98DRAFT_441887, partial [Cadophora sp. DSE1049]